MSGNGEEIKTRPSLTRVRSEFVRRNANRTNRTYGVIYCQSGRPDNVRRKRNIIESFTTLCVCVCVREKYFLYLTIRCCCVWIFVVRDARTVEHWQSYALCSLLIISIGGGLGWGQRRVERPVRRVNNYEFNNAKSQRLTVNLIRH